MVGFVQDYYLWPPVSVLIVLMAPSRAMIDLTPYMGTKHFLLLLAMSVAANAKNISLMWRKFLKITRQYLKFFNFHRVTYLHVLLKFRYRTTFNSDIALFFTIIFLCKFTFRVESKFTNFNQYNISLLILDIFYNHIDSAITI